MITFNFRNILSLVCIVSLSLFAFSCSDDDDNTPPAESTNNDLNGVWLATSFEQSGVESISTILNSLEMTFRSSDAEGGSFTAVATDISDMPSTFASTYTVVDDGNRIVIGTDTLDLTASSSNLTLVGNLQFSAGEASIMAEKQ